MEAQQQLAHRRYPDGPSYLKAYAYDRATNVGTVSSSFKKASDTALPGLIFTTATTSPAGTTPISGSTVIGSSLPAITGVAVDDGSGVAKVEVQLYRPTSTNGVYEYWNGSGCRLTSPTVVQPRLSTAIATPAGGAASVNWSRSSGWPSGSNLTNGTYTLRAWAYDQANNSVSAVSAFKVANNITTPTVSFTTSATAPVGTTPLIGSKIYNSLPTMTGVATDNGSGVAKVELRFYRASSTSGAYDYWDGTTWQTISSGPKPSLNCKISPIGGGASVSWSRSGNWPSGSNLRTAPTTSPPMPMITPVMLAPLAFPLGKRLTLRCRV